MPDPNAIQVTVGANTAGYVAAMKEAASATSDAATQIKGSLQGSSEVARDAVSRFAGLGQAAKEAGEGVGAAGEEAGRSRNPFGALTDVLKDYRKEVSQESRISRMLALDIAGMGIAGKGAAGEITAFVGAFAIGGGIGLAIEGVKFLVKSFNETREAESKAREELKQFAEEGAKGVKALREEVDALTMSQNAQMMRQKVGPLLEEETKLRVAAMQASAKMYLAEENAAKIAAGSAQTDKERAAIIANLTSEERKAYEQAKAKLAIVQQEVKESTALVQQAGKVEEDKGEKERAAARIRLAAEVAGGERKIVLEHEAEVQKIKDDTSISENERRAKLAAEQEAYEIKLGRFREDSERAQSAALLQIQSQLVEGETKIRLDGLARENAIRADRNLNAEQMAERLDANNQLTEHQITELHKQEIEKREDADVKAEVDTLRLRAQGMDGELGIRAAAAAEAVKIIHDRNLSIEQQDRQLAALDEATAKKTADYRAALAEKEKADAAKKLAPQIEEQKKLQHAAESAARSMGDAFGASFAGVIQGTETVAGAIKNMLKSILKSVVDLAIASITASAAKAAAEAASSQAGIPIVGPALAAAAMAAMGALVMGLVDTLPSAAVGADIPTFSNPVMQLHGGEAVITHPTTDALKEFLDGGGGDVHVHIHGAIDGPSVQRVVHSDAFVRAIRDARRTGRMP